MAIDRLVPAPYNPREIAPAALAALTESFRRFGLVQPLVWNRRTGHVVGGNQRLKVLLAEGVTDTAVAVVDLPLAKEKALCLALNNAKSQGDWVVDGLAALVAEVGEDAGPLRLDALLEELVKEEDEPAPPPSDPAPPSMVTCPECGARFVVSN